MVLLCGASQRHLRYDGGTRALKMCRWSPILTTTHLVPLQINYSSEFYVHTRFSRSLFHQSESITRLGGWEALAPDGTSPPHYVFVLLLHGTRPGGKHVSSRGLRDDGAHDAENRTNTFEQYLSG